MLLNDYKDIHWSKNSFDFPAKAFVFKLIKATHGKKNRFWKRVFQRFNKKMSKSVSLSFRIFLQEELGMASKSVQWSIFETAK